MISNRLKQRATALTWTRGCVQENDCWDDCYESSLHKIQEGRMDEWDRQYATVKQYRELTGAKLGAAPLHDTKEKE